MRLTSRSMQAATSTVGFTLLLQHERGFNKVQLLFRASEENRDLQEAQKYVKTPHATLHTMESARMPAAETSRKMGKHKGAGGRAGPPDEHRQCPLAWVSRTQMGHFRRRCPA